MTFLFTAREIFDTNSNVDEMSWDNYIEWSKLTHLTELVSLDSMLNDILVEPDLDNAEDWDYTDIVNEYQTGFFTTLEFVFKRMRPKDKFNLLMGVIEPEQDCKDLKIDDYDFVGYELLDQDFNVSALTNCGGYDETFFPTDINNKGLIDEYSKAYDIKKRLLENNPNEYHADTNVIAVWRHKTIGR